MDLPTLIGCDLIPNNPNEIATPEVAVNFSYLVSISHLIPAYDSSAKIQLPIGRDLMPAHYVLDQKIGKPHEPYAQKLALGWVIVGEACLDGVHIPTNVNSMKTFLHPNGKPSTLEPCINKLQTLKSVSSKQRQVTINLHIQLKMRNSST